MWPWSRSTGRASEQEALSASTSKSYGTAHAEALLSADGLMVGLLMSFVLFSLGFGFVDAQRSDPNFSYKRARCVMKFLPVDET